MVLASIITCLKCGHQATEQMPEDACRFLWRASTTASRSLLRVLFLRIDQMPDPRSYDHLGYDKQHAMDERSARRAAASSNVNRSGDTWSSASGI
jgi:hypothetical protein